MTDVLVCGMAVVDFVFQLDRLPQRPEKYRADAAQIVGGGCAANAAVAIQRLGGAAHLVGRLGADGIGEMIAADLVTEGVDCTHLQRTAGGRSAFSSVYLDAAGERQIVNFRGDGLLDDAGWIAQLETPAKAALADTRWPAGAVALMALARARGIPGVIDAEAPVDPAAVRDASHIAFSAQGLRDFTGTDALEPALSAAARSLSAWLCVTDGPAGIHFTDGATIAHVPTFDVPVVDTLGAGDVWHGAFTLALGEGLDERAAMRFASATAALKCTRTGGRAGTPTRADVTQFLEERP